MDGALFQVRFFRTKFPKHFFPLCALDGFENSNGEKSTRHRTKCIPKPFRLLPPACGSKCAFLKGKNTKKYPSFKSFFDFSYEGPLCTCGQKENSQIFNISQQKCVKWSQLKLIFIYLCCCILLVLESGNHESACSHFDNS